MQENKMIHSGFVRGVSSGDTVSILKIVPEPDVSNLKDSPRCYDLCLDRISAPLLAGDNRLLASLSRDFLRGLLIGRVVNLKISTSNPRYGKIFFKNGVDVSELIIKNGWATLNKKGAQARDDPTWVQMEKWQEEAKSKKLGIWQDESSMSPLPSPITEVKDSYEVLKQLGKDAVSAVVEKVISGSCLRVYIEKFNLLINVFLAGVTCPSLKSGIPEHAQELYARAATLFVDLRVLNRTVSLQFEMTDNNNNFYVWLKEPVNLGDKSLNLLLLENGLGSYVSWSCKRYSAILKQAEISARLAQVNAWKHRTAVGTSSSHQQFYARVVDIINVGKIVVSKYVAGSKSALLGEEIKIGIANIKTPKYLPRGMLPDGQSPEYDVHVAHAAYDYLCANVYDREVRLAWAYDRSDEEKSLSYYDVYVNRKNLALEMVSLGYAWVMIQKFTSRFPGYLELCAAENAAKKSKLGVHGDHRVVEPIRNSSALPASTNRKKQLTSILASLQASGAMKGIVERVVDANSMRIWLPDRRHYIAFSLRYLKFDRTEDKSDDERQRLACRQTLRKLVYLHRVAVIVESVDGGRPQFSGSMECDGKDVTLVILELGLAKLNHYEAKKCQHFYPQYRQAEKTARNARLGVWVNFVPNDESSMADGGSSRPSNTAQRISKSAATQSSQDIIPICLTHIIDGVEFYFRKFDSNSSLFKAIDAVDFERLPALEAVRVKDYALCRDEDGSKFRTRIKSISRENNSVTVQSLDYGDDRVVRTSNIRQLPDNLSLNKIPALALRGSLAYTAPCKYDEMILNDLSKFLRSFIDIQPLPASIDKKVADSYHLVIADLEHSATVNSLVIRSGLAHATSGSDNAIYKAIKKYETFAKDNRLGMWRHGDVDTE